MRVPRVLFSTLASLLVVGFMAMAFMSVPAMAQTQDQPEMKIKDTPANHAKIAFKAAAEAFKSGNLEQAIDKFLESEQFAEEAGIQSLARKAHNNAIKLQYNLGKQQLQQGNYEAAIAAYEKGIGFAPDYANNYFMKAYALGKMGEKDQAIQVYQKAIAVAEEQGEIGIVNKAKNNISSIYLARASQAFTQENYEAALQHLNQATEYIEPDADIYYQYARAYNGLQQWQQALEYVAMGLEVVNPNNQQQVSNLHYQKGVAHKRLGQLDAAIVAFQNVTAGPYQQNAQYELEHNLDA